MVRKARSISARGVCIRRVYEAPSPDDGFRVLVDRLWPRGIARNALALAAWHKELAPTDGLRCWFTHDPARWTEFAKRYRQELRAPAACFLLDELTRLAATQPVTLLYGARDQQRNNAVVVRGEIERRIAGRASKRVKVQGSARGSSAPKVPRSTQRAR